MMLDLSGLVISMKANSSLYLLQVTKNVFTKWLTIYISVPPAEDPVKRCNCLILCFDLQILIYVFAFFLW